MTLHEMKTRPPSKGTGNYDAYLQPGRVHSSVYTSPDIFEAELEKIFYRTCVFVGHESEIPAAGDFRVRKIGRKSLIFIRNAAGETNVLFNRCRHRGAALCSTDEGNATRIRCWYHGWVYDAAGQLLDASLADAYGDDFDKSEFSLSRPAQVDSYRGFVFANLSPGGPSLREHLGLAAEMMDLLVDASPVGSITLAQGRQRTVYGGNWKFAGMDGYHGPFLHASVFEIFKTDPKGVGATHEAKQFTKEAATYTRAFGNGHSMLDQRDYRLAHPERHLKVLESTPGGSEYIARMREAYGERADLLITSAGDPHMGLFPNMQLLVSHVRIVVPLAVDRTEIISIPVLLDGVSEEMNDTRFRAFEGFYGPCGYGAPDDAEIFERMQVGLQNDDEPWVDISRGMHRERVDTDGSLVGYISDEIPQRSQMAAWVKAMNHA